MPILNKRYSLLSLLGKGGMGVVYKASDLLLGNRFVAIKEMSQRNLDPQELAYATTAFKREALILARLSHPSLPRIYDHFDEGGKSYLVMDFIDGETLAALLRQTPDQGLRVEEFALIAEQLCSVLAYLHSQQPPIIFRDIKPDNIMITANADHLYLVDFGIARFFKPGQSKDTLFSGTAGYAAPEQYNAQTSEYSDIYSLGVTFHELLTGLDPTKSRTSLSFPSIREHNPQVSPLLDALIMQMLEPNPANRPAPVSAIKQELRQIQQWSQGTTGIQGTKSMRAVTLPSSGQSLQGERLCVYRRHADSVYSVAWSPDGKHIVSGGRDKTVQIWDASTGEKTLSYKNHTSYVYSVAWSPNSNRIASTSFGNVHIWNATSGDCSLMYREHSLWVYALAWSPVGFMMASCGADGEVHLWDTHKGEVLCKYQDFPKAVRTLAWSIDTNSAKLLVGCEDALLYCWEVTKEWTPVIYQGHKREVTSVAWSPGGQKIVSGSRDRVVKIWDVATGNILRTYQGHTKDVYAVAWSPDGTQIASAGEDKTVRIWEVSTGNTLCTYQGHTKDICAVAWSPDGTRIASASEDKTVHVWC